MTRRHPTSSRRDFLRLSVGAPAALALGAAREGRAQAPSLAPTPACPAGASPTPTQTAGPFFKPASPRRASLLEPGMTGTRIVVTGLVLTTDCTPVAGALVDFWQADDRGQYDNTGYRLRGHQITDRDGRYRLETIMPGLYSGRTRHIHVNVQGPGRPGLTTQLYFPGEPGNERDFIFRPQLVVQMRETGGGRVATFDFVLGN
jgi:protocatechuate 3,4-dioxygenase beta subunit